MRPEGSVTLDFGDILQDLEYVERRKTFTQSALDESNDYKKVTRDWYQAFLPIFERTRNCPGTKENLAASSLMLRYLPSRFATAPDTRDHIHVVELARQILEKDGRNSVPGKAVFTFDTTVIIGLFLVATSCPEVAVRRQAIGLFLKYPRREGLLVSMMVVTIATWMLNQEEERIVDGCIPETSKLRIVRNDFDLKKRKAVLICSRSVEGGDGRVLLPEVTLCW